MDVRMPVVDKLTATRAIRDSERGCTRAPIIALTANTTSHQVADYIACGMDGYYAKLIEAAKLFNALGAVEDVSAVSAT